MRNLVKGAGTPIWPALMLLLIYLLIFTPRTPKAPANNLLSTAPEENEVTDAPLRMLRAEFKKMMDPSTLDVPLYKLRAAEEEMVARLGNSRAASLTWTERGPSNIGGRTRALLVDASDGTGNKVFAGGIGGGLWVTTNFKNANPTWTVVNDFFANLSISCIRQNPVSNSIIYFGTGEGWGNIDAIQGGGIYKSTDGGNNWSLLPSSTGFSYVQDLEFDNNGYIYASTRATNAAQRGIMRSTDGGTSWVQVLTDPNGAVTTRGADLERAADGDMYATVGIFSLGHIFRSASNGVNTGISGSWTEITPSGITTNSYQRVELAVCPSQGNRIYAAAQAPSGAIGAIYRSDNDGAAWTTLGGYTWCDQGASTSTDFTRGQAWYDLILSVDPTNSDIVFAGGVVLVKSTNAGGAWLQATRWTSSASCTAAPVIHADIHEVIFLNTNEMIVGTDGGIFYSSNAGNSYSSKNNGFNVTQYYGLAQAPQTGSNSMLGGTQDNGSHLFSTSGINSVSTVTGGDGGVCFIDSTNSSVWVTSNPGCYMNVYRSNGTYLGTGGSGNGRFISTADYAHNLNIVYYGDGDGLYGRLFNVESGSATYGTVNVGTEMGANRQVSCVKVDPADETVIWLGCSDSENNTGAAVTPILLKVIRANNSTSGAPSTRPAATAYTGPALAAGAYISNIDIEKGNSNHMILSVSNFGVTSIWESTDGGTNWSSVEGNLPDMPVRWAAFIPSGYMGRPNAIGGVLLGTELGVWSASSLNGGSTNWVPNNSGLANVRVDQLLIRQSDKAVAVATHGRGVFTANLLTTPLPVTLTRFYGEQQGNNNKLYWQTASEYNSARFELERSYDGVHFEKIAGLPAAGMSNQVLEYTYTDRSPRSDINYYRLRSVDQDGETKLSNIVLLQMSGISQQLYVLGNPFHSNLDIRLYRAARLPVDAVLLDMGGRVLKRRTFGPGNLLHWDLQDLPAGNYILQTRIDGQVFRTKLTKN